MMKILSQTVQLQCKIKFVAITDTLQRFVANKLELVVTISYEKLLSITNYEGNLTSPDNNFNMDELF